MIENHIAEVEQLQYVAYRQRVRLQRLLKGCLKHAIVLQVSLEASQRTVQVLSRKLRRTSRGVCVVLDDKRARSVFLWLLDCVNISSRDLTDSKAEDTQELFAQVR